MTDQTSTERPTASHRPRRRRRRVLIITTIVVVLAAAAVLDLRHPFGSSPTHPLGHAHPGGTASSGNADPTTTATATRRTLSSQTTVDATLGYADSYTVVNQLAGTGSGSAGTGLTPGAAPASSGGQGGGSSSPDSGSSQAVATSLPKAGQVITQGQVLYRVDGQPVVLLYGSTPAYRTLAEGTSAAVTGEDVRQLNADLVALGYASTSELDPSSDEFSSATKSAVEKLQDHLGVDQTGALDLGQVVFLPAAIRVTSVSATLAATISPNTPVLTGTSITRQVSVDLDTSEQSEMKVGDKVNVTLPNNHTTPGVVSGVGTVASSSSSTSGGVGGQSDSSGSNGSSGSSGSDTGSGAGSSSNPGNSTVEVDVRLTHPAAAGAWDQAPVQVTITTDTVHDALVVPVVALLARSGGGYAVEVAAADGARQLVPVSLGLFDDADGLVQVTGTSLAAGQHVVVPTL